MRLEHRLRFLLRPSPPYSFELTVHKPAGWPLFTPSEVFQGGTLWTALHVAGALVGLKLRSSGSVARPAIAVEAFLRRPPSRQLARAIRATLVHCLSTKEDLRPFYAMARHDPILRPCIAHRWGMHDTRSAELFSSATLAILLQMAPLARSQSMIACMVRRFGAPAELDGQLVHAWPTPEAIAALGVRGLRSCHLGYRAKHLVGIARAIVRGYPTLDELERMSPDEAWRKLLELPGVGPYSAGIISPHASFPLDSWSLAVFGKLLSGSAPANTPRHLERVRARALERWGEHAWLAFFYVVQDLPHLARALGVSLRLQ